MEKSKINPIPISRIYPKVTMQDNFQKLLSKADESLDYKTQKNLVKREMIDNLARIPGRVFESFYEGLYPNGGAGETGEEKLYFKITGRPLHTNHYLDMTQKFLPPMQELLPDQTDLYNKIMRSVMHHNTYLSKQVIDNISISIKDFLKVREYGVRTFFAYKYNPKKLLHDISYHISLSKKDISDLNLFLEKMPDESLTVSLDEVYGTIIFSITSDNYSEIMGDDNLGFWNKIQPEFTNSIAKEHKLEDAQINIIFSTIKDPNQHKATIKHENQHMIYKLVAKDTFGKEIKNQYFVQGQDEILAYIKILTTIENTKFMMHDDDYNYYQKYLNQLGDAIKSQSDRVEMKEGEVYILRHRKDLQREPLMKLKKEQDYLAELEDALAKHKATLPDREYYKSNLDKYIDAAYAFKDLKPRQYMDILMVTPMSQRPELIEIYNTPQPPKEPK